MEENMKYSLSTEVHQKGLPQETAEERTKAKTPGAGAAGSALGADKPTLFLRGRMGRSSDTEKALELGSMAGRTYLSPGKSTARDMSNIKDLTIHA